MATATLEHPDSETVETTTETREQLRNKAKLLFHKGLKWSAIAEQTGVSQNTLRVWSYRGKWQQELQNARLIVETAKPKILAFALTPRNTALSRASEATRNDLASLVAKQLAELSKTPIKGLSTLRNTPAAEGLASVTKRIADTAALVFDWGSQRNQGFLTFEQSTLAEEPAIDVQATCGQEPTTSSVPPAQSVGDATTSQQPTDSK